MSGSIVLATCVVEVPRKWTVCGCCTSGGAGQRGPRRLRLQFPGSQASNFCWLVGRAASDRDTRPVARCINGGHFGSCHVVNTEGITVISGQELVCERSRHRLFVPSFGQQRRHHKQCQFAIVLGRVGLRIASRISLGEFGRIVSR